MGADVTIRATNGPDGWQLNPKGETEFDILGELPGGLTQLRSADSTIITVRTADLPGAGHGPDTTSATAKVKIAKVEEVSK